MAMHVATRCASKAATVAAHQPRRGDIGTCLMGGKRLMISRAAVQRRAMMSSSSQSQPQVPCLLDQMCTVESGQLGTLAFAMFLKRHAKLQSPLGSADQQQQLQPQTNGNNPVMDLPPLSFWHDIPLVAPPSPSLTAAQTSSERLFHYVNEIPMGTKLKMEINTKREFNPIQQDTKNNIPRVFMYGNIPFNYGCLPQTWENPEFTHPDTKCGGDNDPIDVVELGNALPIGKITRVKILGSFALIDGGETDWKILAIREDDPISQLVNDIDDIRKKLPAKLETIYNWYRYYKTAEGKPENKFALDGRPTDKKYAIQIVEETHAAWKELIEGRIPQGKLWIPATNVRTSVTG